MTENRFPKMLPYKNARNITKFLSKYLLEINKNSSIFERMLLFRYTVEKINCQKIQDVENGLSIKCKQNKYK